MVDVLAEKKAVEKESPVLGRRKFISIHESLKSYILTACFGI